jgi:multidrug resistance efflux pump
MSDETLEEPVAAAEPAPSVRDLATALIDRQLYSLEAQVKQAFASMQISQIKLQAAKLRAPHDIERLVAEMGGE